MRLRFPGLTENETLPIRNQRVEPESNIHIQIMHHTPLKAQTHATRACVAISCSVEHRDYLSREAVHVQHLEVRGNPSQPDFYEPKRLNNFHDCVEQRSATDKRILVTAWQEEAWMKHPFTILYEKLS